jgi:hypothetical protein
LCPGSEGRRRRTSSVGLGACRERPSDLRHCAGVGDRYCTADGWTVQVIGLSATPERNDGERLKVTYCGFFVEGSGIAADGRASQLLAADVPSYRA